MDDVLATGTRTVLLDDGAQVPVAAAGAALADPPYGRPVLDVPQPSPFDAAAAPVEDLAPRIQWGKFEHQPVVPAPQAQPAWVEDFVQHRGQSEAVRNPNASLRVQVPVAAQVAPSARVL